MTRRQLTMFLATISVMEAVIIGAIVGATAGPTMGVLVGVGGALFVWLIVGVVGRTIARVGTWATLARRYPAIEGVGFDRGARVISLGLGRPWMRLNNCVEAVADESHLHMRIGLPGTGDGRPVSIPWEAVTSVEASPMGQARLDIEGVRLWMPRAVVADELALREALTRSEAGDEPADSETEMAR